MSWELSSFWRPEESVRSHCSGPAWEERRSVELPSTIVIVAYRKSHIPLAEQVAFVHEGRVVVQGTHADLLESQPGYARLVQAYEHEAAARAGRRL